MMEIFRFIERDSKRVIAETEEGKIITAEDFKKYAAGFYRRIGGHRLIFLLCENNEASFLSYLSCLYTGIVPLLLDGKIDSGLLEELVETYRPAYIFYGKTGELKEQYKESSPQLNKDLALLLTTSGSTGSPKLVRITGKNLDANAASIAGYLRLDETERAVTMLPMSYSYGMSVINSHMYAGAEIIISSRTILEKAFWDIVETKGVTSLVGVPYTYQMFLRAGIMERKLPNLRYLTQAGGKLSEELHKKYAAWATENGKRFYVMYGQTEASPRMAYLPPEKAIEKCGSMGVAIPGGVLKLLDDSGKEICEPDIAGEMVYYGDNVSMGYAVKAEDLILGDDFGGVLKTGDMAKMDKDGFFYVTGRKKRFIKLYGNRVNLDQTERILAAGFKGSEFACAGNDDRLTVYYTSDRDISDRITDYLCDKLGFTARTFSVNKIEEIPKNAAGKTLYSILKI